MDVTKPRVRRDGVGRIAIWTVLTVATASPLLLLVNAAIARLAAPAEAASIFSGIAWAIMIAQLCQLGLHTSGVQRASRASALHGDAAAAMVTSRVVALVLAQAAALFLIVAVVSIVSPTPMAIVTAESRSELLAIMLLGAIQGARLCVTSVFRVAGDFKYSAIFGRLLPPVLTLSSVAILIAAGFTIDRFAFLYSLIAAEGVGLLGALGVHRHLARRMLAGSEGHDGGIAERSIRGLYAGGFALAISGLAINATYQSGVVVAGYIASDHDTAIVGLVFRLWALATGTIVLFNQFSAPQIARLTAAGELRALERVLGVSAVLSGLCGVVAAAIVGLGGPGLIALIFGEPYREAAFPTFILFATYAITLFLGQSRQVLSMGGHPWLSAMTTGSGLLVIWIVSVMLYPLAGPAGIAMGVAVGLLFAQVLSMVAASRVMNVRTSASLDDFRTVIARIRTRLSRRQPG